MQGKTVVITGGTSGIGLVAAERLAGMGARLVLVARNPARAESAMARIKQAGPGAAHTVHFADLSSMAETKKVAAAIAAAEPRIDVLINNAGAMFNARRVTPEGLELTFALNHMAYWIMTHGLRERLVASGPARIVSTASQAHRGASLDFDDLQCERGYKGFAVYGKSKLANILFTRALAKRTAKTQVTVNCIHPGFVATRFGNEAGGGALFAVGLRLAKLFAISEAEGGARLVHAASASELETVSGAYLDKDRVTTPSAAAQDDAAAERLWDVSRKLAGVT